MSNLSLRYYKKPKNKFLFRLQRLLGSKSKFFIIPLILLMLGGVLFALNRKIASSGDIELLPIDSGQEYTILRSKKPFYADYNGNTYISNIIDNEWLINLGRVQGDNKINIGEYTDIVFLQIPHQTSQTITYNSKYKINSAFSLDVSDEYNTNEFSYKIKTPDNVGIYTIFDGEDIIYEATNPQSMCLKSVVDNKDEYNCKTNFLNRDKKLLDIKLRDKSGNYTEVSRNKIVQSKNPNSTSCTPQSEVVIGQSVITCTSSLRATINVQDKQYTLEPGKPLDIVVATKLGSNVINITGSDASNISINQTLTIAVQDQSYFDIKPTKERYPLEPNLKLEFTINSTEKFKANILSNAKESKKGYSALNAIGLDTNFNNVSFESKDVAINSTDKSLVFQIDPRSKDNLTKTEVYPGIVTVEINVTTDSNKKFKANCKMIVAVTESNVDKSTCTVTQITQ